MTFGERLKKLREAAGLSQDKLAHAAGLSVSTVTKIEQRAIDPAWSTVEKLARALGVDCRAFQDGIDAGPVEGKPSSAPKRKTRKDG